MKMPRLAFSTNAFKQHTLEQAVRRIAAIGYGGVEIMADAPHMNPLAFDERRMGDLRRLLEDLGLAVSNVNAFTGYAFADGDTYHPTWIDPDPARRQQRVDFTRRAIELAAGVGGRCLSVQPGGPAQGRNRGQCAQWFAEGLAQCLPLAQSCRVVLGIEPEPGLLIERSEQFLAFKQQYFAGEPSIAMNADLGHFFCCRQDPLQVLQDCAAEICHVHIEDISADRIHQHLPLGQGAMDFQAIFATLDRLGYEGFVTVELYPYTSTAEQAAAQAWQYLEELARRMSA